MPPPTPTSTSPARIAWSSRTEARRPEAHTLLMVSLETSLGMPALIWAWREGIWPWPGLEDLAHDDVLHLVGRDVGALERRGDGGRAELGGIDGRQAAAHLADGRTCGTEDHGLGHVPKASDVACLADARLRHDRRSRRHGGRHDRRRRLRRRGGRARPRGRPARRAARGRRGAHELQAPRPAPGRRTALAARRPRARASASTPSARGSPRRPSTAARASSARARCAGSCPTMSPTTWPPRWSRGRSSPAIASTAIGRDAPRTSRRASSTR